MIAAARTNALGIVQANPLRDNSKLIEKRCSKKIFVLRMCRCSADSSDEGITTTSQDRRRAIASLTAAAAAFAALHPNNPAQAIQGLTAGRIPGISGPGPDGFYKYQRPEGKSGMHLSH